MSELLLEIFSEEIPARMQVEAAEQFLASILKALREILGLDLSGESWVTPRRLGLCIAGLPSEIPARKDEIRGPKVSAPEAAIEGFLKKNNFSRDSLITRDEYFFAVVESPEQSIHSAIVPIIESVISSYTWPKSMRWANHEISWVRPIHSILCIIDGKTIPITFGHITASNYTYGHRFMAPEKITINDYADYKEKLNESKVILETQSRKEKILADIDSLIAPKGLKLIEDAKLLEEIAGLVEYPYVLLGEIGQEFMSLPHEVLVITLRHHQKYLMLKDSDGNLAPYFVIVSNRITEDHGAEVIRGNAKVLRARLSDASFFYNQDRQLSLEARVKSLNSLTYHQQIGTVYEKTQSTVAMARRLANALVIDETMAARAAELCKADLVSEMVKEFPELQGVMGYYYALNDNEPKEVALAIRDHYKPQGPSDVVPQTLLGGVAALADKLDTLNQMFAIGIKPTGSKDPFALRRAAIGISRIITHYNFELDLAKLGLRQDVIEFINEKSK